MGEAGFNRINRMAGRIKNKMKPHVPNIPRRGQTAVMGDINRSIEKMSIGEGGTMMSNSQGFPGKQRGSGMGPGPTTAMMPTNRRDSNWTVSTEGYGSMRSNTSASRRCSELSQVRPLRLLSASQDHYNTLCTLSRRLRSQQGKQCRVRGTRSPPAAPGGPARPAPGCHRSCPIT